MQAYFVGHLASILSNGHHHKLSRFREFSSSTLLTEIEAFGKVDQLPFHGDLRTYFFLCLSFSFFLSLPCTCTESSSSPEAWVIASFFSPLSLQAAPCPRWLSWWHSPLQPFGVLKCSLLSSAISALTSLCMFRWLSCLSFICFLSLFFSEASHLLLITSTQVVVVFK